MYGCYGFHLFSLMLYSFPFSRCFPAFVCFLNVDSIDYILVGGIWIVCEFAMVLFIWTYIWIIFGFFLDIRNSCSNSLLVSLVFSPLIETWNKVLLFDLFVYFVPFFGALFLLFSFCFWCLFFFLSMGLWREVSQGRVLLILESMCWEILVWVGLVQLCHFNCY